MKPLNRKLLVIKCSVLRRFTITDGERIPLHLLRRYPGNRDIKLTALPHVFPVGGWRLAAAIQEPARLCLGGPVYKMDD